MVPDSHVDAVAAMDQASTFVMTAALAVALLIVLVAVAGTAVLSVFVVGSLLAVAVKA